MKKSSHQKTKSTLKQKFTDLIETLRSKTVFQNQPHLSFQQLMQPLEEHLDKQIADILPTTHNENLHNIEQHEASNNSCILLPSPREAPLEPNHIDKKGTTKRDSEIEIQERELESEVE